MTDVKNIYGRGGGTGGIGFLNVLFITFLVLKLTGVVGWSWWWVAAPLWVPWALIGFLLLIVALLKVLIWRGERKLRRLRRERLTRRRAA